MPSPVPNAAGCRCDQLDFPPLPDIPAGLEALPRQLAGFPEYRLALLRSIPAHILLDKDRYEDITIHRPLTDWRARESGDLGTMLLEMWAYVLDILAFYDERIANESYLQTAVRDASLRKLVNLIGYLPRPAIGAEVTLALLAEKGKGLISIPRGMAFRSGAFGSEKPQIFETSKDSVIDPALNRWTLAPIRPSAFDGRFLMPPSDAGVSRGDLVLFNWDLAPPSDSQPIEPPVGEPVTLLDAENALSAAVVSGQDRFSISGGNSTALATRAYATKVTSTDAFAALDGKSYVDLSLDPPPTITGAIDREGMSVQKPTQKTSIAGVANGILDANIDLSSQQDGIKTGDLVLISRGDVPRPFRVTAVGQTPLTLNPPPQTPALSPRAVKPFIQVTRLTLFPSLPDSWTGQITRLTVHFGLVEAGSLTTSAKNRLTLDDLRPKASFDPPVEPPELDPSGEWLLSGKDGHGAQLGANVTIDPTGSGSLSPDADAEPFAHELRTPVLAYGNLVDATRGETVPNEVLGHGDATVAFQSFKLKKSPLTYLNDGTAPDGRRSTLSVRVNGILWNEVRSYFGTGPQNEVYIVRQNEKGESTVTFGDGKTGARLPSGVRNVTATYRFGAGAAKPPANLITQLARPVPGVRQVVNPVAAQGGDDADQPKDLRKNAPASALLLGRAISLPDFEALAREFGGVVNARASWTWDTRQQRAVVKIWFIADGGALAQELRAFLLEQSDPNTPISVCEASAVDTEMIVDLVVDARYPSDDVEQAVALALTEPEKGILALENIPIGLPIFRSAILEQIHRVEGVETVRSLRVDGVEAPYGLATAEGAYRSFLSQLVLGNTAAGDFLHSVYHYHTASS